MALSSVQVSATYLAGIHMIPEAAAEILTVLTIELLAVTFVVMTANHIQVILFI